MNKTAIVDGVILASCVVLSSILTYFLVGIEATLWSALSGLHAYKLFNEPKNYKNYTYVFLWSMAILFGMYIGCILKINIFFYLYLVIMSFLFYHLYGNDPVIDLSMKYVIIFSTVGTGMTYPQLKGLTVGLIAGTLLTLSVCYFLSDREHMNLSLNKSLKENLFKVKRYIVLRSLVYSSGLIICLLITEAFQIGFFYWALLTFVFVLHPKSVKIVDLTVRRVIGILIVVILLYFLFNTPWMPYVGLIMIVIFAFLLPFSSSKDYIFTTFCTTGFVLAVIEMSQYWITPDYFILFDRLIETVIGGGIAIICSIILQYIRESE